MTSTQQPILRTTPTRREASLAAIVMVALILTSSFCIAIYTVSIRRTSMNVRSEHAVERAALTLAGELLQTTVSDERFGKVGICDVRNEQDQPIFGLERLKRTSLTDRNIASTLKLPAAKQFAQADLERLIQLETQLATALSSAIEPSADENLTRKTLYDRAFQIASHGRQSSDETLTDLKIILGTAARLPVGAAGPVIVHKEGFVSSRKNELGNAVLLEAVFTRPTKDGTAGSARTETTCAVITSASSQRVPAALLVSCPHGLPPTIRTLRDLVSREHWDAPSPMLQSKGGAIPGSGHLAPPAVNSFGPVSAGAAIELAIYDWMRQYGPELKAEQVAAVLDAPIAQAVRNLPSAPRLTVNSALTKDLGARRFALVYQSGAGGKGQEILKHALDGKDNTEVLPKSALPLIIDATGMCRMAGGDTFAPELALRFLNDIHKTNIASTESKAIARAVSSRMERAIDQTDQHIRLLREELPSIQHRIDKAKVAGGQTALLERSKSTVEKELDELVHKRKHYYQIQARARIVERNGQMVGKTTFVLSSDLMKYAKGGLVEAHDRKGAYILSNKYLFVPHTQAATEEDLYRTEEPDGKTHMTVWTNPNLDVMRELKTPPPLQRQTPTALPSPAFVALWLPRGATSPEVNVSETSPFEDTGLPEDQLVFYGSDALKTGAAPQIGWSVLVRDVVAFQSARSGSPLKSKQARWCSVKELDMGACPGLAAEIQLRAPVPIIPELPVGSIVLNPETQETVSQIPPTPAAMI